jgi:hypothetical protein
VGGPSLYQGHLCCRDVPSRPSTTEEGHGSKKRKSDYQKSQSPPLYLTACSAIISDNLPVLNVVHTFSTYLTATISDGLTRQISGLSRGWISSNLKLHYETVIYMCVEKFFSALLEPLSVSVPKTYFRAALQPGLFSG